MNSDRESSEQSSIHQIILDQLIDTFFVIDENLNMVQYSHNFSKWNKQFGKTQEIRPSIPLESVLDPLLFQEIHAFYQKIFAIPIKDQYEFKIQLISQREIQYFNFDFIPLFQGPKCERILTIVRNISFEKLRYLEQENEIKFSKIISMISSMLLNPNLDETIPNVLKVLTDVLHISKAMIFREMKIQWCYPPEIKNEISPEKLKLFPFTQASEYRPKMLQDLFLIFNIESSEPNIAQFLRILNFQSILIVPLIVGKERFGEIVVNHLDPKNIWQKEEIHIVLTLSILIGLALKGRIQSEPALTDDYLKKL